MSDEAKEMFRRLTESRDEHDERELRRIEHHKTVGTDTWDDHMREAEIRRRRADRAFEERERRERVEQRRAERSRP